MNTLLTANGIKFPCNFFGVASAGCLIVDVDTDLITAANIFNDENETSEIKYIFDNNGEEEIRLVKGFTSLLSVSNLYGEITGVRIMLQRPFSI